MSQAFLFQHEKYLSSYYSAIALLAISQGGWVLTRAKKGSLSLP